jgi:hypothetical protein
VVQQLVQASSATSPTVARSVFQSNPNVGVVLQHGVVQHGILKCHEVPKAMHHSISLLIELFTAVRPPFVACLSFRDCSLFMFILS